MTGTLATAEGRTGTTTLENIKVTDVYVEVGDEVQEGDIICTFDSSDIESALADAENNYAVNQQLTRWRITRQSTRIRLRRRKIPCRMPGIRGTHIKMCMKTRRQRKKML